MLQNSCQSSGFLDLLAFLHNRFFLLHNFFQVFTEPGKVVRWSGTYWFIMLMILVYLVMFWVSV